jgi:hypothetical protein
MAMTVFLSGSVGQRGDEALQPVVAGLQVVAAEIEQRSDVGTVAGEEGRSGLSGGPAGEIQAVEQAGQTAAVLLDGAQDLGHGVAHS